MRRINFLVAIATFVLLVCETGCAGALAGADLFGGGGDRRAPAERTMVTYCGSCHYQYLASKREQDYEHKGKPPQASVWSLMNEQWAVYNHSAEPLLATSMGREVVTWLNDTLKKPSHAAVVVPEPDRTVMLNYLACQQFYQSPFHCGR